MHRESKRKLMSLKKDILIRVSVVYLAMVIFALVVIGRTLYLQSVEKDKWQDAEISSVRNKVIEPNRGNIYTSDGRMLAVSIPFYEVRLDMRSESFTREIFDAGVDTLSYKLAGLFKDRHWTSYKQGLVKAREKGNRFYLVKRNVTHLQLQELKKFPIFREGRYKGGVVYVQENKRIKPHGLLAARTIGNTNEGDRGSVVGIEGAYDADLSGIKGYRLMRRISGDVWMPVTDKNEVEPRDGFDVVTTLDIALQDVAENALLTQLSKQEADHGTVVVMEVATGKVKAIANLGRNEDGSYSENYNYAIGESTEPGSTFKLASVIALLEDGYVRPEDKVDVGDGVIKYYGHKLEDSGAEGLGVITIQEAFEKSSNVGISKMVREKYKNNPEQFVNRLYQLRLNQKLDIEVKGEGIPDIKYTDSPLWSGLSLPMMSIGYEVRLTPLQILAFYNAIANGGEMVRPLFVEEVRDHGKIIEQFEKVVLSHKLCSEETLEMVKDMLEGVVENGTAKNLRNSYYNIAGKTGTCQIAEGKSGYEKKNYQASFVGYFPADDPQYSCIVVVTSPSKSVYYGNLVAGPIFREITDKIFVQDFKLQHEEDVELAAIDAPYSKSGYKRELESSLKYLEIPFESNEHESEWVKTKSTGESIALRRSDVGTTYIPDVSDMGARDAVYLLENMGMRVEVNGRGTVRGQQPLPGALIRSGELVKLEMSLTEG